jgi:AraC family transcriptional regulator of adaptative response / DNA-3-methyladenine glycosylase II
MTTYSAVVTTGIYCRPGCGAKPLAENVRVFEHAAAAEAAGFRACYRCRPYRAAGPVGSAEPELICYVVQLVIDGALDDGGTEQDLATHVGMSARHLRRLFARHLGATPDQLARSRRAHFARRLLDDTDLSVIDVAFASGYGSLRQFNRAMQGVFRASPTDLRSRRRQADRLVADGGLDLRLPVVPGYDWDAMLAFLARRACPGVEEVDGASYRRAVSVDGAPALIEVSPGGKDHLLLRVHLPYWEGLIHLAGRVGRLLGTETDHAAAVAALGGDQALGDLIRRRPGLAVPGTWSAFEAGVWSILSRYHDVVTARVLLHALATTLGVPVPGLPGELSHVFPDPVHVTAAGATRAGVPVPEAAAIAALAAGVAAAPRLPAPAAGSRWLPGVDDDTRQYIAFRLGAPAAFPLADPSLRAALADLGLPARPTSAWRPWLALAATHLMVHGDEHGQPNPLARVATASRS